MKAGGVVGAVQMELLYFFSPIFQNGSKSRAEEGEEGRVKHLKCTRWHETRRWHETTCVYMQRTRTSVATCHMAAVATCHITCRHTRTHRLLKRVVVTQYAELAGEGPQHHERHALACARDAQDNLRGV